MQSEGKGKEKGKVAKKMPGTAIVRTEYEAEMMELRSTMPARYWEDLFCKVVVSEAERAEAWLRLQVLGFPLCEKYSWAIPTTKAVAICREFAPLVEVGAGKGYWSYLLQQDGVDILALDKYTADAPGGKTSNWAEVSEGGPEKLDGKGQHKIFSGRNLLLCYPDEAESVAMDCLENFRGEFVVHVGELITTGTKVGGLQTPWGRTTSSDFQVALLENFHNVLVYKLPSFPFANDYVTVWKRSEWTVMPKDEDDEEEEGEGEEEEEADSWRDVPADERLPDLSRAAPKYQHLLENMT